jgi:hypothetical protein
MQARFNKAGYWDKVQSGELTEHIISRHKCGIPEVEERHPGVVSVIARYRDKQGNDIAEVHYYALPDGSNS